MILAAVLCRGAREIIATDACRTPEGMVRAVTNTVLRDRELWSKLEPSESKLLTDAEGGWLESDRDQIVAVCEQIRLLRWALGIDRELVPVAHFPKPDTWLGWELVKAPVAFTSDRNVRFPSDLRTERDISLAYAARAAAELRFRGLIGDAPMLDPWADEFRSLSVGESSDFIVGYKTMADLSESELRLIVSIASSRERYAAYLVDQLSATSARSFAEWSLEYASQEA